MSNLENNDTCGTSCGCGTQVEGYWQDVEEKVLDQKVLAQEFPEAEFDSLSVKKTRRNFLKIMGFSVSALPLTGCIKIPVKKALPYLKKQESVVPGVANWYASTVGKIPVLVKTREGRPIKVEGNDKSQTSFGGTNSKTQASVLSLYDSYRYKMPVVKGISVEWNEFDEKLKSALKSTSGEIVVITPSMSSPAEISIINQFLKKYKARHIAFDAISQSAFTAANKVTHGKETSTEYDLEKADTIVSFGADFLGTFGNDVANTKKYTRRRNPKHPRGMNKHIQVEQMMSLTGSNADLRYTKSLEGQKDILLGILSSLTASEHIVKNENKELAEELIQELSSKKGYSLLLSSSNDINVQVIVNKINDALGNYSNTLWVSDKGQEFLANNIDFENFVASMDSGKIGGALFINTNPAYNYHNAKRFKTALEKVAVSVSFSMGEDETSSKCAFVAPMNHSLESWSDTMVSSRELSLSQPVIQPLFGSRMWTETLMRLAGISGSFYDQLKSFWEKKINWNKTLHDGVITFSGEPKTYLFNKNLNVSSYAKALKATALGKGLNLVLYSKMAIGDGDQANNPWLQELPDPITKATWDNYAMISPVFARENSIKSGDIVELSDGSYSVKVPAIVQPGTEKNTVALAMGYGRSVGGKVAKDLGVNAYPFVKLRGSVSYTNSFVSIKKTGAFRGLAQTQTHHSMEGRDIVRETILSAYQKNPKSGNEVNKPKTVHIYPAHKKDGHQWAMAINLSSCTGCSACVISCNAENNIPVVGREEIAMRRDMHWMRLDRYYKGDENQPEVMHMPMLCQHCDNAPCENVCPVMATVQSSDGLNQQIYNRCVGTRYCANNCPYKVRRFNWFNYDRSDEYGKMVLNPDVNVRTRGVMEKCSMCIQRIQDGKLTAKRERRELEDGDIRLACEQSCPAENAIIFGDMNNPNSKISKHLKDDRQYTVLEELNVQPRVNYLTKIRNK